MKFFICVAAVAFVAVVHGRVLDKDAKTLSFKNQAPDAKGNYHYSFDTDNDIQIQAAGNSVGVTGQVNYVSPEGTLFELNYTADADGYHPMGKHLPTPPPMPEHIRRSLEYIRSHPPASEKQGEKSSSMMATTSETPVQAKNLEERKADLSTSESTAVLKNVEEKDMVINTTESSVVAKKMEENSKMPNDSEMVITTTEAVKDSEMIVKSKK